MDLYLIRHADALPLGERGTDDDWDRPLSAKGEKQSAALGKMLQRRGVVLDQLVASPLLRAQQTAQILRRQLQRKPEVLTAEALAPDGKFRKLGKFLRVLEGQSFGLVGHMPHLAEWTGWLIGARDLQLEFAKAGVAHVHCGELPAKGLGVLHWLVTPEIYS